MKKSLLLNADFAPLKFINVQRALVLVLAGKAEVVDGCTWDDAIHSPSVTFQFPTVIRLVRQVTRHSRFPFVRQPRFERHVMFIRDDWRCQYCGAALTRAHATVDHVVPKSRGGGVSWTNCVTACKLCNKKKANRTPREACMALLHVPTVPTFVHFGGISSFSDWHPRWCEFGLSR